MKKTTQISAQVSEATHGLLEKYVRRTGVKKGHLIEQSLLHHLQALNEIPPEYIIHPRIVVSRDTFTEMMEGGGDAPPTEALRDLMRQGDGD